MKVKAIKNYIESNIKTYDITVGKEYFVLQIDFDYNDSMHINKFNDLTCYRIIEDSGIMMPCPSKLFKIIDNKIPSNWVINKVDEEYIEILPEEFLYDGFLEDYYDGESTAVSKVKVQLELLQKVEQL